MQKLIKNVYGLADKASLFFSNIAAMFLLALVVLTVIDVVGRYIFSAPVVGAVELVRIGMAGIIFFSFPIIFLRNDHIVVDLIPFFKSGWIAWVTSIVILAVTAYVAVKVGDRVFDYAIRALEDEDTTEYLAIPRWPIVVFISVALFSAAVMSIIRLFLFLVTPGNVPDEQQETGL